jgi:hypothetical protein
LAVGKQGLANPLSRDLAILSCRVSRSEDGRKPTQSKNAILVRLVPAPEHHALAKQASDEAEDELFVCSHRLSFAGDRPILTPLKAAKLQVPSLNVRVAYGRSSGGMKNRDAKDLKGSYESLGFEVVKADDPQIHGKFISWDNDNLVISSLNWLSASSKGDFFGELGVYVRGAGYAKALRESFDSFYQL